jgi:hypothetical protein
MANFERKPNSGSLFKNEKKQNDTQPNATGRALIGGVEYLMSAWTNRLNDGRVYQSLRFTPVSELSPQTSSNDNKPAWQQSQQPQAQPQPQTQPQSSFNNNFNFDNDMPF